jgi:2'-5' RNA ligase
MGGVDHVVVPLDRDHVEAVGALTAEAAAAMGVVLPDRSEPHVTVVAFGGVPRADALDAVRTAAADIAPFVLRAHGFGVFARTGHSGLSLHVPVIRNRSLDALHVCVYDALVAAGAEVAGWSQPELWSPHITLLDRDLEAAQVGAGIACLSSHHHPSWHVPVERLQLRGAWQDRDQPNEDVPLSPP